MTKISQGESAKIYVFPEGGRATLRGSNRDGAQSVVTMKPAARIPRAAFGSSWYHEAAVLEAEPARKR